MGTTEVLHYLLGLAIAVVTLIFFNGCAGKEAVIYIPTLCKIETPIRPTDRADAYKNTLEILRYTEELEASFKACKGE